MGGSSGFAGVIYLIILESVVSSITPYSNKFFCSSLKIIPLYNSRAHPLSPSKFLIPELIECSPDFLRPFFRRRADESFLVEVLPPGLRDLFCQALAESTSKHACYNTDHLVISLTKPRNRKLRDKLFDKLSCISLPCKRLGARAG